MLRKTFNLVPDSTHYGKILLAAKPLEINIVILEPGVVFAEQVGASRSALAKTYNARHWRYKSNKLASA